MRSTEELIREGLIRVNKEMLDKLDSSITPEPASVTPEEERVTYPEEYSEERREGMIAESEREEAPADVELPAVSDELPEALADGEEVIFVDFAADNDFTWGGDTADLISFDFNA